MKITRVGTRRNEERPSTPGRSFPPYKYERESYDQDVHEKNVLPVEIKNVLASQVVHSPHSKWTWIVWPGRSRKERPTRRNKERSFFPIQIWTWIVWPGRSFSWYKNALSHMIDMCRWNKISILSHSAQQNIRSGILHWLSAESTVQDKRADRMFRWSTSFTLFLILGDDAASAICALFFFPLQYFQLIVTERTITEIESQKNDEDGGWYVGWVFLPTCERGTVEVQ